MLTRRTTSRTGTSRRSSSWSGSASTGSPCSSGASGAWSRPGDRTLRNRLRLAPIRGGPPVGAWWRGDPRSRTRAHRPLRRRRPDPCPYRCAARRGRARGHRPALPGHRRAVARRRLARPALAGVRVPRGARLRRDARRRHADLRVAEARAAPRRHAALPCRDDGSVGARSERQVHDQRGHGVDRARRGYCGHGGGHRGTRVVRIFDTLTQQEKEVEAAPGGRVRIYACGPTVYAPVHVGNARPFVVFSLLKRFLSRQHEVIFVANITDVNDKIYDAAGEGSSASLAQAMTDRYIADTDRLGLGRP